MLRRVLVCVMVLAIAMLGGPTASAERRGADEECDVRLVARDGANPVATGQCPGVRPGAYVEVQTGPDEYAGCTFNFVFDGFRAAPVTAEEIPADDDDRVEPEPLGRHIGTAGHCVLTADGQKSWPAGTGPRAFDANGRHIGHVVFAVLKGVRDFALIELLPGVRSNPQMCHWRGPTGVMTENVSRRVELKYFGQGPPFDETVPARTAYAEDGLASRDRARAWGAVIFGDSGSGITAADGRAVGVIVTMGAGTNESGTGTIGITRLAPQVALAEKVLGANFELVTAPRIAH